MIDSPRSLSSQIVSLDQPPAAARGAVNDDGVELVALHHADIEEASIFGVYGGMQETAAAVSSDRFSLKMFPIRSAGNAPSMAPSFIPPFRRASTRTPGEFRPYCNRLISDAKIEYCSQPVLR
jgi:hypothetical protein